MPDDSIVLPPRPHSHPGLFLALEGPDGAGKTTQAARLAAWLRGDGFDVVSCRDPGSTEVGDRLRKIVLDHDSVHLSIRAEMLIYMASRAQLVDEVIAPFTGSRPRRGLGSLSAFQHRLPRLRRRSACRGSLADWSGGDSGAFSRPHPGAGRLPRGGPGTRRRGTRPDRGSLRRVSASGPRRVPLRGWRTRRPWRLLPILSGAPGIDSCPG